MWWGTATGGADSTGWRIQICDERKGALTVYWDASFEVGTMHLWFGEIVEVKVCLYVLLSVRAGFYGYRHV